MAALPLDFLLTALVTIMVVVDPIGLAPTFLSVTEGMTAASRRSVALRASLTATAILFGATLIGDWLLRTLSISLPAFRIAGGLLLFTLASEMVFGRRIAREAREAERAVEERVRSVAAFPLAIPLMAGPGAITATVLLASRAGGDYVRLGVLLGVIVTVFASCLTVFLLATRFGPLIGVTANVVLSRILGVLLAALAVQFVIDGVRAVIAG
jgi:multiple antibiotic resistance protein